jgi:DNA-binding response OmpR family regulator
VAKILIVDDSLTVRLKISSDMRGAGHEPLLLELFAQLPLIMRNDKPDVIILDINMPALPGSAVAEFVRRFETKHTPIILYSSDPLDSQKILGDRIEAFCCVQKSSDPSLLIEAVDSAIMRYGNKLED